MLWDLKPQIVLDPVYVIFSLWIHTLDSVSLAYPSCQHHGSCAWRVVIKIRVPWTRVLWHHDGPSDSWESCRATREHIRWGYARHRGDSRSRRNRAERRRISSRYSGWRTMQHLRVISGIFHWKVLDCDRAWVTEHMESKTTGKRELPNPTVSNCFRMQICFGFVFLIRQ